MLTNIFYSVIIGYTIEKEVMGMNEIFENILKDFQQFNLEVAKLLQKESAKNDKIMQG